MAGFAPPIHAFLLRNPQQERGWPGRRPAMTKKSIRARLVRFPAGLHQTEAFLDLAEHKRKVLALLRGEAGQDLLLLALQPRDQLLIQRLALSCHAELELAAVLFIFHTFHRFPGHQARCPAEDWGIVGPGAL